MKACGCWLPLLFAAMGNLHAAPPLVTNSIPVPAQKAVDPNLAEFRAVFDQPMAQGGMSVVGSGPTFPPFIGRPRWENERTFIWQWQLQPERDYWLSLNSERFQNFRSTAGEAAVPFAISFRTSGATNRNVNNRLAFVHLQNAIAEQYSFHDLHGIDWTQRFSGFRGRLEASSSPVEFARVAAEMLSPARDIHLWFEVDGTIVPPYRRKTDWNMNVAALPRRVPGWRQRNEIVSEGEFEDGVRYLLLRSWPANTAHLGPAFELLSDAARSGRPLIVDVRANGGGAEQSAQLFAGCFFAGTTPYARHITRSGGTFSGPHIRTLARNPTYPLFTNRVAVLAGPGTVSSGEAFVLMMMQNTNCIVVGARTAGASGNPKPIDLGNGVNVYVPTWKALDLAGNLLEGKGVEPTINVPMSPAELMDRDLVLEEALRRLRTE